jgi:hypothetical protein
MAPERQAVHNARTTMRAFLACSFGASLSIAGCVAPAPRAASNAAIPPPPVLGPGARDESPAWTRAVIPGCAPGFSGPTLSPGDAIRNAQAHALGEFAEAQGVHIASVSVDDGRDVHAVATFVSEATIANVRVVAIETQRTGRADDATARVTHALACRLGSERGLTGKNAPAWVLDPRSAARAGELCAVGLSGPTLEPADAPKNAARDAARALASIRSVLVSRASADHDFRTFVVLKSEARVPDEAVDAMLAASTDRETWRDEEGYGPLALPGTTFVLRCTAR